MDPLDSLTKLDGVVRSKRPSQATETMFFFLEKGVSYNEFESLPLPYIFSMVMAHNYVEKQKEKDYKKSQRKR